MLSFIDMKPEDGLDFYPCVMPNWDNTPRAGLHGQVFSNPSPAIFQDHLRQAIRRVESNLPEHRIIIIKSWNEWAEGNHLEPDLKYGHGFLEAIRREMEGYRGGHP